ncbi:hypothetical protein P8452_32495 [Trifolium repens]|nr:hypothetical protein P8452_32495 [Trifolium repens]
MYDAVSPPFSYTVYKAPLPDGFQVPRIKAYDGSTDPGDHLKIYYANMFNQEAIQVDDLSTELYIFFVVASY